MFKEGQIKQVIGTLKVETIYLRVIIRHLVWAENVMIIDRNQQHESKRTKAAFDQGFKLSDKVGLHKEERWEGTFCGV